MNYRYSLYFLIHILLFASFGEICKHVPYTHRSVRWSVDSWRLACSLLFSHLNRASSVARVCVCEWTDALVCVRRSATRHYCRQKFDGLNEIEARRAGKESETGCGGRARKMKRHPQDELKSRNENNERDNDRSVERWYRSRCTHAGGSTVWAAHQLPN